MDHLADKSLKPPIRSCLVGAYEAIPFPLFLSSPNMVGYENPNCTAQHASDVASGCNNRMVLNESRRPASTVAILKSHPSLINVNKGYLYGEAPSIRLMASALKEELKQLLFSEWEVIYRGVSLSEETDGTADTAYCIPSQYQQSSTLECTE